ncbi:SDR family NAD(P)-dependent oxidoreductase [Pseudonocardia spinosispora]|uniref:SDR family NAD(P)-dependent oxidoreductase n=1 Tax=Pseudonocardia spinosispora TaxID=103441 RepID=UPI000428FFA7|nr:SDR family NAD(P)-dependent oxidoreductase [Pseudonocardia spinosispora]
MSSLLTLRDKVALITGGGQGIGRHTALRFGAHGCRAVLINDQDLERAETVAEEVRGLGVNAEALRADVTDLAAVREIVARAIESHGTIDVLVNNAGNAGANPPDDLDLPFWEAQPRSWDAHLRVNLYGVINCVAACVPGMIAAQRGGRIITVVSDAGRVGEAGLEVYSAAKAGAAGLTRAVARTLGRHRITANCVAMAATVTPYTEGMFDNADPRLLKRMMDKYVIRRPGRPDDAANMVLFLASDASDWITGQTYPVNGGFSFAL